jgi:hypothetical protein
MKWIHAFALGAALILVTSIQIAVSSPACALEPEGKGSKPKIKRAAGKRQHTTPRPGQPPAADPQERKSYGY